jgi:hypothetical protein
MKKQLSQICFISLFSLSTLAQNFERKPIIDESKKIGSAIKSHEFAIQCVGETNTKSTDLKWLPILTNKCVARKPKSNDDVLIEQIKKEKTLLKQNSIQNKNNSESGASTVAPVIGTNFLGNVNNGMSPMDNSMLSQITVG